MDVLGLKLPPCCHISLMYIMGFVIKQSTKEFKPHVRMHHIVVIVIILVIVMLPMCYSTMSHVTLVLYYHASIQTLHTSFEHFGWRSCGNKGGWSV